MHCAVEKEVDVVVDGYDDGAPPMMDEHMPKLELRLGEDAVEISWSVYVYYLQLIIMRSCY